MAEARKIDPALVVVGDRLRKLDNVLVGDIVESGALIGIKTPVQLRAVNGKMVLVAGLHRLEAAKRLKIDVPYEHFEGDDIDAELWEVSENFHRIDLTSLERGKHYSRWVDLKQRRISRQLGGKIGPGRPQGGVAEDAREARMSESGARRALKVGSLSAEAEAAAHETKLDDNETVLLQAAKAPPEQQAAVIRQIAAEKAKPRASTPPLRPKFTPFAADVPFEETLSEEQIELRSALKDLIVEHLQRHVADVAEVVAILNNLASLVDREELAA